MHHLIPAFKNGLIAISLMQLSACASLSSDNSYDVAINSSPSNAQFSIANAEGVEIASGTTPTVVHLNAAAGFWKQAQYVVSLQREGFDEVRKVLRSTIDFTYYGNLLFLTAGVGVAGALFIDPHTGAMFKLPLSLDVNLRPSIASETSNTSTDALINDTELSLPQLPTVKAVDDAIEDTIKGSRP